jgi:hypothetical protein
MLLSFGVTVVLSDKQEEPDVCSVVYCLYCHRMSRDIQLNKASVTDFEFFFCVCVNGQQARTNSSGNHFLSIVFVHFSSYVSLSFANLPFITLLNPNCAQCNVRTVDDVDQCYHP